jgi:6-phosphofructokinase
MNRINRIISTITLTCFLSSAAVSDLALAQEPSGLRPNRDKLAAASRFDDMLGKIELQDMARIEMTLESQFAKAVDRDGKIDIGRLKANANQANNSIFKSPIQFDRPLHNFINEVKALKNGCYRIMCRTSDRNHFRNGRERTTRTYYAVFPGHIDDLGGIPIETYTESEWNRNGGEKFTADSLNLTGDLLRRRSERPKDAEAKRRYKENNEKAVAEFIRERINAGDFTEIEGRAEALGWDEKYPSPSRIKPATYWSKDILHNLNRKLILFLSIAGVDPQKAISGKNIVFIRIPEGVSYPVFYEKDSKTGEVVPVEVKGRISNNALYYFIDSKTFDKIGQEGMAAYPSLEKFLLEKTVHGIGESYGLPFIIQNGNIINDLDLAYKAFCVAGDRHVDAASLAKRMIARSKGLQALPGAKIVDLDILRGVNAAGGEYDRDYAAAGGASDASRPEIDKGLDRFLKKYNIDPKKTILFAMSGGDCAGPNSAYYGAVKEAAKNGYHVLGVMNGFDGLGVDPDKFVQSLFIYTPKGINMVRGMPSLHIGSSRARFSDMRNNIVSNCSHFAGVLFIGGDDHSKQAAELNEYGIPTIVLPKTIDYDFLAESMGAHIAAAEARRMVFRAHEMAREEKFVQVVELMGRDAGWITYLASKNLGDGAFTLIPEKPSYFKDVLIKALEIVLEKGYLTVPMAEGYNFKDFSKEHKKSEDTLFYQFLRIVPFLDKKFHSKGQFDAHGNPKMGGISEYLSLAIRYLPQLIQGINDKLPDMAADDPNRKDCEKIIDLYWGLKAKYPAYFGRDNRYNVEGEVVKNVRLSIPGYVLRGLAPDEYEAYLGESYGRYGIQLLLKGKRGLEVTVDKSRAIGTVEWLKHRKLKSVPIRDIAKKEYVAEVVKIDGSKDDRMNFAFDDAEIAEAGVWWKGCEKLTRGRPRRPRPGKIDLGGGTKEEARKLFLSTAISAATHNTSSVFGFREVEGVDADTIALYAADQRPGEKIPDYQRYCLDETGGSTIILLSSRPSYMRSLLLEIVKRLREEVAIRDEKRAVRKLPRGYVNLAVSDRYKLLDFSVATPLFNRLLQLDLVLEARYKFNHYFFDRGEPGFMELLSTITSAITYLPQLAEGDRELKAGIDELKKKRPEIFGKDPERHGKLIIKGVRLNMPNQALGKRLPRPGPRELRQKGVWWARGGSKGVEAKAPGNPTMPSNPAASDGGTEGESAEDIVPVEEIAIMTRIAGDVGREIAPPVQNYTLFASYGIMNDEEHASDKREYSDRFSLVRIMTNKTDETVKWVLDAVRDKGLNPRNVIVQLPREFADDCRKSELEKLASEGVKYMIIDTSGIGNELKGKRMVYRRNIYAKMLLARAINEDTDNGSPLYRLLRFFVESHIDDFEGKEALVDQYMEAIKKNQIIQAVLSYKPIKRYDTEEVYEEYKGIAAALMSA